MTVLIAGFSACSLASKCDRCLPPLVGYL